MSCPETPMTEEAVRQALAVGEPGDDLILHILATLRRTGDTVEVLEAGGAGPDQAAVVVRVGGRRMRLSAEPW